MPEITADMSRKISSILLALRKARIATALEIREAAREGRTQDRNRLILEMKELDRQFAKAGQMEIDFLASNLSVSKSERRLAEAAEESRALTRRLDGVTRVLKAVEGLTKVLKALAKAVTP